MNALTNLPNIGDKLAALLTGAGITSTEKLAELGSVETVLRITGGQPLTGYNMLYAIEGAIRGVRWHSIPRGELSLLKREYDRVQTERRGG